ncbi:c-type cytochrome [Ornithobacterium rhinotracheale]|uniref:Cytochrome c, mono-and diheme variants family n=1 Tax=Ornithobacterium rhinotracheale (strain ATCC 51463 / DSM 15997 / CCUG 23171 / CIP 104009 / LMG 9086) TaxID=867902 RepID=I4A0Q0_ORNRL|nr:c-type cytochrome [Ornithobacterium rhinotracheale]AFL97534.1 cytochrome c, mono- and diheme variants family [Ornithobacterium rhinotracheale DSM 15997]AIP98940.1 quinol:cytochrome C oxidoreductase [Ornithobacterium rhinotracheale ORT-UMN 88]KGB66881.1 quinol:cytochrome C oxidoreductase [Ornithobacterium rhinotracheale H06-030791]MBN3661908.1 c-type cytochrome [Ornithobacterium rhinotracheale]MCK0195100.1 c-type cytochrome [Ornithobacterium rhinotracheale]
MAYLQKIKWNCIAGFILTLMFSVTYAQDAEAINGDPNKGKELFNTNCAACHQLDKKVVGPALGGIVEKLQTEQGLGREWLHKWIRNNEELRASGDEYAIKVYEENGKVAMTPFPNLTDQQIDDILAYTSNPPAEKVEPVTQLQVEEKEGGSLTTGPIVVGFSVIACLLVWMLVRVNSLNQLSLKESLAEGEELHKQSFKELLEKNQKYVNFGLLVLSLLALYGLWEAMLGIDVNKGYRPEQPIYFSHKIHAGEQGIDCQMCHTSAKYGRVSGIPTTNVCMNCHYSIQEYKGDYVEKGKSKKFYTEEIQKIYASSGFDKNTMTYTGETKPIEWVRVHNMPDFVHFNHAQHVVAGENAIKKAKNVEQVCYACHGRVDEMNVVEMANDFTMGWCINCHRETQVDMDNGYNKAYYSELHEKLKKQYGDNATITVDAIGGLECAKCHY